MSSTINELTKHNIPEDQNLQRHHYENLKSHIVKFMPESPFLTQPLFTQVSHIHTHCVNVYLILTQDLNIIQKQELGITIKRNITHILISW